MSENRKKQNAIGSGFKEQELGQISDAQIAKRLWSYMRPYGFWFAVSLLLLPLVTAAQLLQPHILQIAIDEYLVPKKLEGLSLIVALFGGSVVAHAALQFIQFYIMQWAGQRALRDLRQAVFDHVQTLSVSFFNKNPIGRLMARMTTDVESLQEALSSGMVTMVGDLFTLGAIVVILLVKDWQFALVTFTVVPPLLVATAICRHFLRAALREIRVKIARLYAHLQESITGMPVIQLFVRENISLAEYKDINLDYRHANFQSIRYDAILFAVVEAVGSIAVGVIVWYGSGKVLEGVVTLGVLIAFIEYMQKFFVPIRDLAQKYNLFQSAMASSERIFQLLDNQERVQRASEPVDMSHAPFEIEFRNVCFHYVEDEPVLKNVSFHIKPGERLALVGHTGSGKSTIINLLMRLYDPISGQILVNGVDIKLLDIQQYRRIFAVVLQDVFLFQGTIGDNITLGDASVSDSELEEATKIARANVLINRYGKGFEHPVSERGSNLSAGERQLISFSRALVHKPEILVLDEATANVDTETEALIQEAVEALMARQTSVVIAHRLSTIQNADRILVLHRGEVLEDGSHDELLANGGHYTRLYRLQYAA